MPAAFYNQGLLARWQTSTEGLRLAQIVYNYLKNPDLGGLESLLSSLGC